MTRDPLYVLAVLGLTIALCEWLVRRTWLRHLGTALLVIVVTAVWANLGWVPSGSDPIPLYDSIFRELAPACIFLLLLGVSLADVRKAGAPMVGLFVLGALGTVTGVLVGMWAVGGAQAFGEHSAALGGMFVATYTGGSLNFNLVAQHYDVVREGVLYTGAIAVDSIMTTVWMVVVLVVPRALDALWPRRGREESHAIGDAVGRDTQAVARDVAQGVAGDVIDAPASARSATADIDEDTEALHPLDLGLVLGLAVGCQWASVRLADALSATLGSSIPAVIVLTTLALVCAQLPIVRRLRGARVVGLFGVYIFLAVIGAYCDLGSLGELGALGPTLGLFVTVALLVHGLVTFGGAALLGLDRDMAAVASQANIGGGTSALAIARSLGRSDLVLPAILVGSLGTASGTYLGFLVVEWLG
jgi:uncharacterized membrane protein